MQLVKDAPFLHTVETKIVPVTCQVPSQCVCLLHVIMSYSKLTEVAFTVTIPNFHVRWANTHLFQLSWPPPTPFFFLFFDKLVMRHLQLMHISRNYFCRASSMTCPWDMTCSEMHRSIKPNLSRTMQIMTNSIIPHYALHANLPNSRKSEGLAVLLKGTLSEWMMVKEHLQSPSSSNPSCGHLCPKTTG